MKYLNKFVLFTNVINKWGQISQFEWDELLNV